MTAKTELMQAHETMASVLDAKFAHVPEWKAFRAIDRALLALEVERAGAGQPKKEMVRRERQGQQPSYMSLADQALAEANKPVPTNKLVDFIGQRRSFSGDATKAKIVIQSSLSKDKRFRSVPWDGARAWWYADKPIPKKETAA
jgi:hypothetical protein